MEKSRPKGGFWLFKPWISAFAEMTSFKLIVDWMSDEA